MVQRQAKVTMSDRVNSRTNVLNQTKGILCDNKRWNPQRRYNSHKTLHNIQHSKQLHKTKTPNNDRRI